MKIGIIGYGVVGKEIASILEISNERLTPPARHSLHVYDPMVFKESRMSHLDDCNLTFICAPTSHADGNSIVKQVVRECNSKVICIKSTVVPGTTEELIQETKKKIVFSPEFTGVTPNHPYRHHTPFAIVGGSFEDTAFVSRFYKEAFPDMFIRWTPLPREAEMAKYMVNTFLAVKVYISNLYAEICEDIGVDYEEVRKLWTLDSRIGESHTRVTEERGFGGTCFPKDMATFKDFCEHLPGDTFAWEFFSRVLEDNVAIRARVRSKD